MIPPPSVGYPHTSETSVSKRDQIDTIARYADISQDSARRAYDALVSIIEEAASYQERVTITGIGTFSVKSCAARTGTNPKTGEKILIPARRAVRFSAAKGLKEAARLG